MILNQVTQTQLRKIFNFSNPNPVQGSIKEYIGRIKAYQLNTHMRQRPLIAPTRMITAGAWEDKNNPYRFIVSISYDCTKQMKIYVTDLSGPKKNRKSKFNASNRKDAIQVASDIKFVADCISDWFNHENNLRVDIGNLPVQANKQQFKDGIDLVLAQLNNVNTSISTTTTTRQGTITISQDKYNAMAILAKQSIDSQIQ